MPNYLYKCSECKSEKIVTLPISFDPRQALLCDECSINSMERKIGNVNFIMKKRTLNDWYKNERGTDLLPGVK